MPTAAIITLGAVTLSREDFFDADGRYLIRGDTFRLQDVLTATGCHWSTGERAWVADAAAADRLLAWWQERSAGTAKFAASDDDGVASAGLGEEPCVSGW